MNATEVIAQFLADIFRVLPAEHGQVTPIDEYNAEALVYQLAKHGFQVLSAEQVAELCRKILTDRQS